MFGFGILRNVIKQCAEHASGTDPARITKDRGTVERAAEHQEMSTIASRRREELVALAPQLPDSPV